MIVRGSIVCRLMAPDHMGAAGGAMTPTGGGVGSRRPH
jgi:hypothetical protein